MNTLPRPEPLVIAILDGWGVSSQERGNAILAADTPAMDEFLRHYPAGVLAAAGLEVGLPPGVPGNSEVGHRNIGAGRIEYQILATIDRSIEDGSFYSNAVLLDAIAHAKRHNSDLHLMGLVSLGGVHSHLRHLDALLEFLVKEDFRERVYIHMFTDGRDTPPQSGLGYLEQLEALLGKHGLGTVASVSGRFYAMDRNHNWERTVSVYDMLIGGERPIGASSARHAIVRSYDDGLMDDKIPPTAVTRGGAPVGEITDNDAVIFFNFRPDRARQLSQAFVSPVLAGVADRALQNIYFATLAEYDSEMPAQAAYKDEVAAYPLARVLSDNQLSHLHVAETEKYAHVTYYLNVGHEEPFPLEQRLLINSSAVKDFREEPAMRAHEIVEGLLTEFEKRNHAVYFVNFANADMLGHTGDFEATQQACAVVDSCLAQLAKTILEAGGALVVTADHGKAEAMMQADSHDEKTSHSLNPVPFYYVRSELRQKIAKSDAEVQAIFDSPSGILADVAPTVLDILRLEKPQTMTGVSLLGSLR